MRKLIVNADDFGMNVSATDGVADCFSRGTVTSTTLMANASAFDRAAKFAIQNPELGVGLHFNLTWGRPVSATVDVPALVDGEGCFIGRNELARRLWFGRVPSEQIAVELNAQLARVRSTGIRPTHIDSHQHIHAFGSVFSVIAKRCENEKLPMRVPWVAAEKGAGISRWLRRGFLNGLVRRATRDWQGRIAWNDGLGSLFDVMNLGMPPDDKHYRAILSAAKGDVFELMVHPVTDSSAMLGFTGIGDVSEAEWRYLRTGKLVSLAEELGFELSTYRDLSL